MEEHKGGIPVKDIVPHITIDVRMIHHSGIGTYIKNVIPLIIKERPMYTFNLIGNGNDLKHFEWTYVSNIKIIDCTSPIYSLNEQIAILRCIPCNTELYWVPHYNIPVLYPGKMLVTIHDVFHLAMKQFVSGILKQAYAKILFEAVCCKAGKIICISNFTKKELINYTNCKTEKAQVIYDGISDDWFDFPYKSSPWKKPYLLYVGNVKPHKNLKTLVKAFISLLNVIPHDLIIVGKREGFVTGDTAIASAVKDFSDRIHFTGFVDDDELKQYYANAEIFVFPSLYEGFGLPPLEAMATGCPVAMSNCGALPEIYGNHVQYFDPLSSFSIAETILKLLRDKALQERLSQEGKVFARRLTWENTAQKTLRCLEEVLGQ